MNPTDLNAPWADYFYKTKEVTLIFTDDNSDDDDIIPQTDGNN